MAKPSDKEYALHRKLKHLQEENDKLKNELLKLKQQLEKLDQPKTDKKKPAKLIAKPCPDCGAEIKCTELPHGVMELCSAACGFRLVRKK